MIEHLRMPAPLARRMTPVSDAAAERHGKGREIRRNERPAGAEEGTGGATVNPMRLTLKAFCFLAR
jgi:hypothetical protein